jgi:hypothetical protein
VQRLIFLRIIQAENSQRRLYLYHSLLLKESSIFLKKLKESSIICVANIKINDDKNILENQAVRLGGQVEEEERTVTGDTDERRNSQQQEQSSKQTPLAVCGVPRDPVPSFSHTNRPVLRCSHHPVLVATRAPCRAV